MNESTAAAIAYGLDKKRDKQRILVFDLGGGTFNISIVFIDNEVFEVEATAGDTHLGGEDFDQRVLQYFIKLIKTKYKSDISTDKRAIQKLKGEVEKAKRDLSSVIQTKIEIENLVEGVDFKETLTRANFEELCADLFKKTLELIEQVLKDAEMKKANSIYEVTWLIS